MNTRKSIFEQHGDFTNVSNVVMSFREKVLDSPVTSPYFANPNRQRLIDHQTKFFATLMGGSASYSNEHLERVHDHLDITEDAFLETMDIMTETLEDFNYQDDDIRAIESAMMSRKNHIVARR